MKGGMGDQKVERRATELAERTGVSMAKAVAIMRQEQPPDTAKARGVRDELLTVRRRCAARSHGRLISWIFTTLAEFERELIRERTRAGMAAAKRRGKHVGRPRALTDAQVRHAINMVKSGRQSIRGMADLHRGDRKTIERTLKKAGSAGGSANA